MTTIIGIIQARMGSTRLPGKATRPMAGVPLTEHIIYRLKTVQELSAVLLAVPDLPSEKPLVEIARKTGVPVYKGPEEDVLLRFIQAGEQIGADHILRICGDSPLFDRSLIRRLIQHHLATGADYTCPADPVPLGTGSEVARLAILKQIHPIAHQTIYREHVTTYFKDHPQDYRVERVSAPEYLKTRNYRLTIDTEEDFKLLDLLYQKFSSRISPQPDLQEVIHYLDTHPELAQINAGIRQKDWKKENPEQKKDLH